MSYLLDFFKIVISYLVARLYPTSKHIWLFSERGTDARDNGYWFFRYVTINHEEVESYYCISSDSADFNKVKSIGNVLEYNSLRHGIQYFRAEALLCSHAYLCAPNWHGLGKLASIHLFKPKGKKVFLQHGIIKDMIPGITAKKFTVDLFICGAKPEYEYVSQNYGFSAEVVKYTGLARFDNLAVQGAQQRDEKLILLMPTWRSSLRNSTKNEFEYSEYFIAYNKVLNSSKLIDFLEQTNQRLVFYPHYEFQKWLGCFSSPSDRVVFASFKKYDVQKLLLECNVLITDYSSVFFDVAYLKKPIIFFQFDYDDYRKTQYQRGYFDYNVSFGPVVKNVDGLILSLEQINTGTLNKKFKKNENNFFSLNDNKNSERIYAEVVKTIEKK